MLSLHWNLVDQCQCSIFLHYFLENSNWILMTWVLGDHFTVPIVDGSLEDQTTQRYRCMSQIVALVRWKSDGWLEIFKFSKVLIAEVIVLLLWKPPNTMYIFVKSHWVGVYIIQLTLPDQKILLPFFPANMKRIITTFTVPLCKRGTIF